MLRHIHEIQQIIDEGDEIGSEQRTDNAAAPTAERGSTQNDGCDRSQGVVDPRIRLTGSEAGDQIQPRRGTAESGSPVDQEENLVSTQAGETGCVIIVTHRIDLPSKRQISE